MAKRSSNPHPNAPTQTTYYQPSAYTFTCRGAFHIPAKSSANGDTDTSSNSNQSSHSQDLQSKLNSTYLCNGIETKLKHVADYPLARSKDEAIRWFEGSHVGSELHRDVVDGEETAATKNPNAASKNENISTKSEKRQKKSKNNNASQDDETFSSYGTTQVNILTVQEVQVAEPLQQRHMDPFAGFGPLSPAGSMSPFGILGGLFGIDPFQIDDDVPQQGANHGSRGSWVRGSKSVSSSTRMGHDDNGKRISTTITKTTTVDGEGNRRVETETVVRHLEDGRVERKKEVRDDKNQSDNQEQVVKKKETSAPSTPHPTNNVQPTPRSKQAKPPEVAMIATDSRFGLSITDSKMNPKDPSLPNLGDASKWRKTEYFFKLGRFFPTLGVVSQYYSENDEKQYNEEQREKKKSRWDKAMERDKDNKQSDALSLPDKVDSKAQYYLDKISDQMAKNLQMMKVFAGEMIKPEFPKKVYHSGEKIVDQFGPTVERTGKLMKDVLGMWFGGIGWSGDDGRRR